MDENDLLDDSKEINMVDTRASSNRVHQHPAEAHDVVVEENKVLNLT